MRLTKLLFAATMLLSSTAFAKGELIQLDLTSKPFGPQKTAVLQAVNGNEDYSEITIEKRREVASALDRISSIISDDAQFSTVSSADRAQVLADQTLINDALVQAKKDSRMECTREYVLGSNVPKRVCRTVASRKRSYEIIQDGMTDKQKPLPPITN
jgi:hypothetical protein